VVQLLLDIFKEQNIIKLFDGKKYKNQDVYKKIHQEMAKNGVARKTVEQIKNKWKSFKTAYNNAKKNNKCSGSERIICDFFEDLDEILGSRPASSLAGIDSQEFSQESLKTSHSTASPSTIEVFTDADIAEDDISNCATQVAAVDERPGTSQSTSDTTNWDTPFSRKKKRKRTPITSKTPHMDEIFFKQQGEMMKQFFEYQRLTEDRAAKQRSTELSQILTTFTQAIEQITKAEVPIPPPYPYMMPFSHAPGPSRHLK
jgi:hypothetical protein